MLSAQTSTSRASTSVPHARPESVGDHRGEARADQSPQNVGCENRFPSDIGDSEEAEKYLRCPDRKDATDLGLEALRKAGFVR